MFNIMVVDDSSSMRHLIAFVLGKSPDLKITEAEDGLEAIKMLPSAVFDLVITDIHMPFMDGLKLIELLRMDPKYKNMPIIITTTEDETEDKKKAMSLGATACVTKPIKGEELLKAVNHLLAV
jgi:two-component system chemotaxis response regulator CheY